VLAVPALAVPDVRALDRADGLCCADGVDRAGWLGCAGWLTDARGLAPCVFTGPSTGLYVSTDSIMPATRQTARMLASNGMMPAWPGMTRRSKRRRLRARCSRW